MRFNRATQLCSDQHCCICVACDPELDEHLDGGLPNAVIKLVLHLISWDLISPSELP